MKKQLLILSFLLATIGVAAQVLPKEEVVLPRKSHFNIGVVGGIDRNYHIVDMSYMDDYKYSKYADGLTYGLQLGFSPCKWLTFRLDGVIIDKNIYRDHVATSGTSYPDTTNNQYVNVPLALQLNVGKTVQLHLFGGGYYGYWLTSHRKGRTMAVYGNPEYDIDVDLNSEESLVRDNRTDVGLTFGTGLSIVLIKHLEIGAEVRWYYGMMDVQKEYMTNLNPRYNTTMAIQGGISYRL